MEWSDVTVRLLVAAAAGALIGIHFELRERPGGLRTHTLATFGSALFCAIASRVTGDDPQTLRAIQGMTSGIGFIGGAAVLRRDGAVSGVATAASIWASAGIGCAAGVGDWRLALAIAPFVAFLNAGMLRIEKRWFKRRS